MWHHGHVHVPLASLSFTSLKHTNRVKYILNFNTKIFTNDFSIWKFETKWGTLTPRVFMQLFVGLLTKKWKILDFTFLGQASQRKPPPRKSRKSVLLFRIFYFFIFITIFIVFRFQFWSMFIDFWIFTCLEPPSTLVRSIRRSPPIQRKHIAKYPPNFKSQ